jgi:hypothetical protein
MTNHKIIAQPWQLKAAAEGELKAIILPLPEGCVSGSPEDWPIKSMKCEFNESYRIYLAEDWAKEDQLYISRSEDPNDDELWFGDAEEMPPEAAQYWFEVTGVNVTQAKYLDYFTIGKTGFYCSYPESTYPSEEFKNAWDKAHPEHLWSGANWVIVLEVRIVNLNRRSPPLYLSPGERWEEFE